MSARAPNAPPPADPATVAPALPCSERPDGLIVNVRVTPRGGMDAIDGVAHLSDGRCVLKVRVRVAPEDGAANRAVEKVIARALEVPVSRVAVAAGATSRLKQVRVEGEPLKLLDMLRACLREGRG